MPNANGMYYFAHQEADNSKKPLIFIHGAGGTHLHWSPELRRLSRVRVYAPDLPGHGKSGGIGAQSIEDYAEQLFAFMDAVNLPAAIVAGHSMGSAIALQMALLAPQRVSALALFGSGSRLRVAPSILEKTANPATFSLAVEQINAWAFAPQTNPRLKALAEKRMSETRPGVLHGDFLACDAFDVSDMLADIRQPALILVGSEDKMTPPKYAQFLQAKMPAAELRQIEGAGHMLMLEKPQETAAALDEFLARVIA